MAALDGGIDPFAREAKVLRQQEARAGAFAALAATLGGLHERLSAAAGSSPQIQALALLMASARPGEWLTVDAVYRYGVGGEPLHPVTERELVQQAADDLRDLLLASIPVVDWEALRALAPAARVSERAWWRLVTDAQVLWQHADRYAELPRQLWEDFANMAIDGALLAEWARRSGTPGEWLTEEKLATLTPRQREVVEMVACQYSPDEQGMTNAEAAEAMRIEPSRVKELLREAAERLGLDSTDELRRCILSEPAWLRDPGNAARTAPPPGWGCKE